jgi:oligosaccharide repeat unit polymerase
MCGAVSQALIVGRWRGLFPPASVWLLPFIPVVTLYASIARLSGPERIAWYAGILILGATVLTRICRIQKQFDLFEPLHLAFALFLVFYPIRALLAVWLDESWFNPSQKNTWIALSASALGYLCFAVGYKLTPNIRLSNRPARIEEWNVRRARFISRVLLFLGLTGFILMPILGGSLYYFITLDADVKAPGHIAPWFFYLLWLCLLLQVGALVQFGIWLSTGRRKFRTIIYCLLAFASTLLLARYFTVLFLLMLALCWHCKKSRIKLSQFGIACLFLVFYLGVSGLYREWISPQFDLAQTGDLVELASDQHKLILRYVVGNLENLSNLSTIIAITPDQLPYQFGLTLTPIFLKPVPRTLLPQKPLGASALFTKQIESEYYESGLVTTAGAWGEWYLNFSWLGLSIGMGFMGAISAATYRGTRARDSIGRVLLYSCFLVMLFTWLRADFNSASTYYLYYAIPIYLALRYITGPKRRSAQLRTTET